MIQLVFVLSTIETIHLSVQIVRSISLIDISELLP